MHVINGTLAPQKMLILGTLQHCQLTILIDSGSTHIFIDPRIIKKANVTIQSDAVFEVMVANGDWLKGNIRCIGILIQSRGISIKTNSHLLNVEGCEAMLGA